MSDVIEKLIGDIFSDFQNTSNLKKATIKKVNLYKKTNRFEILLKSDEIINIKDIHAFEEYLINRFKFQIIIIKIEYSQLPEISILEKWEDIINYMAYKYPSVKAILKDSIVEIDENNNINVKLHLKGAEILYARGMDNVFSEIIYNIYGKRYKIKYTDNNSDDLVQNIEKMLKNVKCKRLKKLILKQNKSVKKKWLKKEKELKQENKSY